MSLPRALVTAVIQARMSSTRLPGKVMEPILGKPLLEREIERISQANTLKRIILAISTHPSDDVLQALAENIKIDCFRGDLTDVLDRLYHATEKQGVGWVVRLTGDCPLIDPHLIDRIVEFAIQGDFDYASNTLEPTYPDGLDVEVIRISTLKKAWQEATRHSDREHVTPYVWRQPGLFHLGAFKGHPDLSHLRWTVDHPQDIEFVKRIYERLYPINPHFDTAAILALLDAHPELTKLNVGIRRNEGYRISSEADA